MTAEDTANVLRHFATLLAREGVAARLRPDTSDAEIAKLIQDMAPRLTLSSPPASDPAPSSSPDSDASAGSPDGMHCDAVAVATATPSATTYKLQLSHDCQ
jgi:hypothetical protein